MAHSEQAAFFKSLVAAHPDYFTGGRILEFGSLDINGSLRAFFFQPDKYVGVDLGPGRCVDVVCPGQDFDQEPGTWDAVVSAEMFEHNAAWAETWRNMIRMARPGGLVAFTCATVGRGEHGTGSKSPESSPFTTDYYENRVAQDFIDATDMSVFEKFEFTVNHNHKDLQFWGIKNGK